MRTLNKKTQIVTLYILYLILVIIFFKLDIKYNLTLLSWISNLSMIVVILSIYILKKDILDFNIVFMVFIFLFCNGNVFLYSLGIKANPNIFPDVTQNEITKAIIYFILSYLMFGFGIILTLKKDKENKMEITDAFRNSIKIVGFILLIVSIIPYFYKIIYQIIIAHNGGYGAIFKQETESNGLGYVGNYFIPSIILLLYSYKNNKNKRNILFLIAIITAILCIIPGGKGEALSIIVILVIFYNKYIKKFEGKKILKLTIIVMLIMTIIPIVTQLRSGKNTFKEVVSMTFNGDNNPIVQTISELGGTMYAWCLTERVVPRLQEFKYGESYISSIMMIIPSAIWGNNSFTMKASLDIWLQNIHNMSYGPGFNIFAETYYNFGWTGGIFFAIILGIFFGKILNIKNKDMQKNELLKVLALIFLFNSLLIARKPFQSTMRNLVYIFLAIYILTLLIYNYKKKKENIK